MAIGADAGAFTAWSKYGKFAGMSDKAKMVYHQSLVEQYGKLMADIENVRAGYVTSALSSKANQYQLFSSWASATMAGIEIADRGAKRQLDIAKENIFTENERAVYYGNAEYLPGYGTLLKGQETPIKDTVTGIIGSVSASGVENVLAQPSPGLEDAGKIFQENMAKIQGTPAERSLAMRHYTKLTKNRMRAVLESAKADVKDRDARIQNAMVLFENTYMPKFADADWQGGQERVDAIDKMGRFKDGMDEATKILGPSHAITKEYNKLKKSGATDVSPKELSEQAGGIAIPETMSDHKRRLIRLMEESEAGSETLPAIRRAMELPGFQELVSTLGYAPTLEGARKVLRYMGTYPGQSAKMMNLHNRLMADPRFADRADKRKLVMRFYLENQVDAGSMKHQLFRTKAGVRDYNRKLAKEIGLSDLEIGRLVQGVQSYVDSDGAKLEIPKADTNEALMTLNNEILGIKTGPEMRAKLLTWMGDNMDILSDEAIGELSAEHLPNLVNSATARAKAEESRIEDKAFGSRNETDLLEDAALDQETFGTSAFDTRDTDADVARSVKAQQDMVDAMGAPHTQGESLGELGYRDALAAAALEGGDVEELTRTGYLGTDPKKPASKKTAGTKSTPSPAADPVVGPPTTETPPVADTPPPVVQSNPLDALIGHATEPKSPQAKTEVKKNSKEGSKNPLDELIGF